MATIAEVLSSVENRFEAEILLAHVLKTTRSFVHAFPEKILTSNEFNLIQEKIAERKKKKPLAYLTGQREFWSLPFKVTPDVLIPRPETELLVEKILQIYPDPNSKITLADLGTGTGAIALAIASERPHWEIHATDVSDEALSVAKFNATALNLNQILFHQGHWCDALPSALFFDVIISNPPYIAIEEKHLCSPEISYEPALALMAENNGLNELFSIIQTAKFHLKSNGILLVEHGFNQAKAIQEKLKKEGYHAIQTCQDLQKLDRVTLARL